MRHSPVKEGLAQARRQARRRALQALYQWEITGEDTGEIDRQFRERQDMSKADVEYFSELLHGVSSNIQAIDNALRPHLDRDIEKVDPVECAILRLSTYELMKRFDVPYKVAINEAVELAKKFGAERGHRFVNGVLDKAAQSIRSTETEAAS